MKSPPDVNYILKEGSPTPSWKEAFISVITKEGKDKRECTGYRPISVLNTDYKLYAAILTRRLETAMPQLIDVDQTGLTRNRQTQDKAGLQERDKMLSYGFIPLQGETVHTRGLVPI